MINHEHTRAMPAAWPRLLARADKASGTYGGPVSKRAVWQGYRLFRMAEKLPDLALEQNFYYGLGKVMCGMAKKLHDPAIRKQIIQDSAKDLIEHALQARPNTTPRDKPYAPRMADLYDLASNRKVEAFYDLGKASHRALTPGEQSLTNMLQTVTVFRRRHLQKLPLYPRIMERVEHMGPAWFRGEALSADMAATNTLAASAGALMALLRDVPLIESQTQERLGDNPISPADTPIDMERLRTFQKAKYFAPLARLRIDEASRGHGWAVEDGRMTFHTEVLREPPLPLSQSKDIDAPLRTERLGCEALYAGGLAIDVAVNILPDILRAAQQIVPAEQFPGMTTA